MEESESASSRRLSTSSAVIVNSATHTEGTPVMRGRALVQPAPSLLPEQELLDAEADKNEASYDSFSEESSGESDESSAGEELEDPFANRQHGSFILRKPSRVKRRKWGKASEACAETNFGGRASKSYARRCDVDYCYSR